MAGVYGGTTEGGAKGVVGGFRKPVWKQPFFSSVFKFQYSQAIFLP